MAYLWIYSYSMTSKIETFKSFDPYEILEVERDAEEREIKKAFRKLSLKWHPDKNRENPLPAAKMFHSITKAYEALTDEKSRENWEKYGNPDGPAAMQVAIGLPMFILEEDYALYSLVICFAIVIIIVPFFFLCMGGKEEVDDKTAILQSTGLYRKKLNENLLLQNVPAIAAETLSFFKMPT